MKNIGFVGLGVMGEAMAEQLLSAGYSLRVWNRTASKGDGLVSKGAARTATPADAARGADAVITMVADAAALRRVTLDPDGLLAALAAGATHLSMSTISGEITTELAGAHQRHGSVLIGAPVFGSKESAVAKKLWGIASGPRETFERARPVLEAMTQKVMYLGDDPAAAARMKVLCNMLISSAIAAMVQVFITGRHFGLDPAQVMDVIRLVFNSPVYERYGGRLVSRDFALYFPLKLMLKDVSLALEMGVAAGVPMPHASAVRDMLLAAINQGFAEKDAAGGLMQAWETASGVAT